MWLNAVDDVGVGNEQVGDLSSPLVPHEHSSTVTATQYPAVPKKLACFICSCVCVCVSAQMSVGMCAHECLFMCVFVCIIGRTIQHTIVLEFLCPLYTING